MSQSKNGNSSSNSSKFHKGLYDTESLENKEDIYNTDIPIEHRISTLFKHLKAHKINQDIDIELLLGSGIHKNQADNDGKTILMYAAEKGDINLVQSLLFNGADPTIIDKHNKSALFYAIDTHTENIDVVSLLINQVDNINTESTDRMTPLLKAVERSQHEIAKLLLEKGALISASLESTGETPLHIAVKKDDRKMIELLFERHCDAMRKNKKKQTALDLCEPGTDLFELVQRLTLKSKDAVSHLVTSSINVPSTSQNKINLQNEEKISSDFNEVIVSHFDQPPKVQKTEKAEKIENKKNKQKGGNQTSQDPIANQENRFEVKESEDSGYQLNDFPDSSDDQNSLNQNRDVQRKRNTSGASGASFSSITSANSDKQSRENIGPLDPNPPFETTTTSNISPTGTSKFSQNANTKSNPQNQNLNPQMQQGPNNQNSNQKGKKQKVPNNNNQPNNGGNQNQGNFNNQKQQQIQNQQLQQQQQQVQQQTNFQPQYNQFQQQQSPQQSPQQFPQQQMNYNQNVNFNGKSPQQDANGNPKYQKNQNRQFDQQQRNQMNQSGHKVNDQKQSGLENNFTPSKDKSQQVLSPHMQNGMNFGNQQMNMNPMSMNFNYNPMGFNNPNIYMKNQTTQNGFSANGDHVPRGLKLNVNLNNPQTYKSIEDQANLQTLKSKCEELNSKNSQLTRERNDLKSMNDDLEQKEKKLQELIKEKDTQLKGLISKNENLEKVLKNREADGGVIMKEEKSSMTESFHEEINSIEKLLEDPRPINDPQIMEDIHNQLHDEIMKFEQSVNKYNEENKENYDSLIKKISEAVSDIVPDSVCEIYGSFATGLSLPWSDIDIVVKLPNPNYTSGILDNLEMNLKKKKWVVETKYIRNTTVPVLKITCIPKENSSATKKIDISIQDPRHNGLPCVELVKDYLQVYPSLRALVLVLKHLLFTLNLNDTYSGGLSSYGLILMIVAYFQARQSVNSLGKLEDSNLATFLIGFLYHYGFEYDYYNIFIVAPKKPPKGKERNDMMDSYQYMMNQIHQNPPSYQDPKIFIQDPLSLNNNVGRSTFHIKEIKLSFMAAFFEACKPCNCAVHNYASENLGDKKTRCSSIFRRMLNAYQPNR